MGFDIENQSVDNFSGIYNLEYFTNENLVEIPRNIKPERYSIVHTLNNKKISVENDEEQINILNLFFKEDKSDLLVQDIIVGKNTKKNKETDEQKNSMADSINKDNEKVRTIDSEDEIIQLLE